MCRMLFAHCASERSVELPFIAQSFAQLSVHGNVPDTVSPGHQDGWGMSMYSNGALVHSVKSPHAVIGDTLFSESLEMLRGGDVESVLFHLRKASVGEPSEQNSHPFIAGKWSFIHNGTIGACDHDLLALVDDVVAGETDSERYFHLVLKELNLEEEFRPEHVREVIKKVIESIRLETEYTSASSIMTDGEYVYVIKEYDETHKKTQDYDFARYYTLYVGKNDSGSFLVSSEPLPVTGYKWIPIENHTLLQVNSQSGEVELYEI